MTYFAKHQSPIGPLLLVGDDESLTGVYMDEHKHGVAISETWIRDDDRFADARRQLDEYFAGTRRDFDLPLGAKGTAFQEQVWEVLRRIPFGETWPYRKVAQAIGKPSAVRAVGAANGRNPISIIVPCHRVVGSDGSLTGYAGGEDRKRWLLAHEGVARPLPARMVLPDAGLLVEGKARPTR